METIKKKSKGYFTTGEFAKLCNVKKQTLFHYDNIGILKPEITGENGYRYYSAMQLETFNTISMLKELDMPLADIREYLNSRNPDDFVMLLREQLVLAAFDLIDEAYDAMDSGNWDVATEKLTLADEKIAELQWLKSFIQRRINITLDGINAQHNRIYLEERPEEYYIITEYTGNSGNKDIYPAVAKHIAYCHDNQIYSPYGIGALVPVTEEFTSENSYNYSHLYTKIEPVDITTRENVTVIPPRTYAVIVSTEGYSLLHTMYLKLLKFAEDNGFKKEEYFFEDTLLDDMSRFSYDDYVLRISLPLKKD